MTAKTSVDAAQNALNLDRKQKYDKYIEKMKIVEYGASD